MDLQRLENEDFLQYAERLLEYRKEYDLDKAEIYELLYDEQVSSDHARKCLTSLEKTIARCKEFPDIKVNDGQAEPDDSELCVMPNYKNTIELNKDGSQTSDKLLQMSEEECKDVRFLLEAHGYDVQAWELVSARNNIWNVYSKQDGVQTLYSSKIVVKPVSEYVWNAEDIKKLFNNLHTFTDRRIDIKPLQYEKNGKALVIPIADLHYSLVADKFSTGNDYNVEIAEQSFYAVLQDVIDRITGKRFEKVLFVIGNDFINADNLNNTTTKGTPQDVGNIWFKIVQDATQMIIKGIDMLTGIAPIDVVYVPSNHDLHTMFGIMQTIKAWYRNAQNVTVDDSPLPRKYYKFGKNLLSFSHDLKIKDALKIITTEARDDWSDCSHVICMLAHLHQAMVYEKQGYLEIWRLPTVSGYSRWSNNNGYIQSEKKNQSFIIDTENGISDLINTIL